MSYHLAQINIGKFRLPAEDPVNRDFVENLGRINAIAEQQPGFIWRLKDEGGGGALAIRAFDDPNIAINMSVWKDLDSLAAFAYRNLEHRKIMMRRREWFEKIDFNMALWWIPVGYVPTPSEGRQKLELIARIGSSADAFLFHRPFPAPGSTPVAPILDRCG